jgi:hypothetical protein
MAAPIAGGKAQKKGKYISVAIKRDNVTMLEPVIRRSERLIVERPLSLR